MIGKIIGAGVGRRIAGSNNGFRGALLGAAAPWLLRRAFTPLGFVALGAYGAKKLYDRRRARRLATPVAPLVPTAIPVVPAQPTTTPAV